MHYFHCPRARPRPSIHHGHTRMICTPVERDFHDQWLLILCRRAVSSPFWASPSGYAISEGTDTKVCTK